MRKGNDKVTYNTTEKEERNMKEKKVRRNITWYLLPLFIFQLSFCLEFQTRPILVPENCSVCFLSRLAFNLSLMLHFIWDIHLYKKGHS